MDILAGHAPEMDRRKGSGMSNIYKRGAVWWCRFTVSGQEHRESLRTGDRAVALRRAGEIKARLTAAAHFGEHRTEYMDAAVAWASHLQHHVSQSTADRYLCSFRQIDATLRTLFVDEIDARVVRDIIAARRQAGAGSATIKRDLTALSVFLDFCMTEGWRREDVTNPALAAGKRIRERRDPIVLPAPADLDRVIARAPGNMKAIIQAARLTGCRLAELVSAERRMFDRPRRQLTVIGKGNKLRTVSLWREGAFEALAEIPAWIGSPLLFHHDGEPYRNLSGQFRAIVCAEAKSAQKEGREFRAFRFHDLRHLYAVEALKSGRSIYDVQQDMGHSSITVTEGYLAHLTPEEAGAAQKAAHGATVQNRAIIA